MSPLNSSVCAIHGCKNKNQQKPRKHVFFYRFPKIRDLAKKWITACNRNDLMDLLEFQDADYLHRKRYMVCSDHFEMRFFKNKELLSKGLIKSAVPTKNLVPKREIVKSCSENMVENIEMGEIKIKFEQHTCYGCLSTNRKTSPLGHLSDMYSTLLGPTLIEDTNTNIQCCWECIAVLRRLQRFQNQLKRAQDILTQLFQESHSLSTLTTAKKDYYDREIHYTDHTIHDLKDNINTIVNINDFKDDTDAVINENDLKDDINQNIKEETNGNAEIEVKNWTDFDENATENDFIEDVDLIPIADENNRSDINVEIDLVKKTGAKIKKRNLNSWRNIKKEYKSYARHICHKNWKKPYTQYFSKVYLDEAEIEYSFLKKDRKRQGYKMHLKCKTCSLVYGRKIDLDRHNNLNHHKPNAPYKCLHCKEPQSSLESLKEHWRSHSVFYKCKVCSCVVFPCSLALHLSRSHVNVYACTNCTLSFSSLVSFSEHYNKNHPFVCDHCNKKCALRTVLEKHIKNHHTPQHCSTCNKSFDSHKLYRAHCREMHPDVLNIGAEPEMCYCVECDRQFPSRALYMKHVNSKHTLKQPRLKRTPCPECGKAFNKNSDMLLHYNFSHVKVTKYHCDLCDKYFLKMYGLRTHMESVHLKLPKLKNKICDLCGRAFQSNSVLDNHRRTHTGERPFKCGTCPAAFAQKGAMKIHQRKQHAA